jgi:hypothetical protein
MNLVDGIQEELPMGKSAPAVPDYRGAAEETAQASRESANQQNYANRPDQTNPWGATTYGTEAYTDPATGQEVTKWSQNQTLDPKIQGALDSQLALTQDRSDLGGALMPRVAEDYAQGMDFSKYGDPNMGVSAEAIDMSGMPKGVSSLQAGQYNSPELQQSLDYSGASEVGQAGDYRNQAEDAMYNRRTSRLDPQFEGRQEALEVKLNNQGLRPGDQAYDSAMQSLGMERTDAYSAAQNEAIMSGGAEASRMFGMDMSRRGQDISEADTAADFYNQSRGQQSAIDLASGGQRFNEAQGAGDFQNAARQRALAEQMTIKDRGYNQGNQDADRQNAIRTGMMNEEMAQRGANLNEVNALISGQQVSAPQMAGFQNASRAQGADYSGAMSNAYDARLNQTNASNAGVQGMMNMAGTAAGMFSDRRLKKHIKRVGQLLGYPLYRFQYLWGDWAVGVMSDEINQDAVFKHASGYDMVNYKGIK